MSVPDALYTIYARSRIAVERTVTRFTQITPNEVTGCIYDVATAATSALQGIYTKVCSGPTQKPVALEEDWVEIDQLTLTVKKPDQ